MGSPIFASPAGAPREVFVRLPPPWVGVGVRARRRRRALRTSSLGGLEGGRGEGGGRSPAAVGSIYKSPSDRVPPQAHSQQTACATGQVIAVPRAPVSCLRGREPWIPDRPCCQGGTGRQTGMGAISFRFHLWPLRPGSWDHRATWLFHLVFHGSPRRGASTRRKGGGEQDSMRKMMSAAGLGLPHWSMNK